LEGGGGAAAAFSFFCESFLGFVVVFDHNKYRKAHNEKGDDGID
jgi:formiminotetrahydrofolate cyclodeaminase